MKKKSFKKTFWNILFITACPFLFGFQGSGFALEKVLIFPIPQHMELTDDAFAMDESVSIIVPQDKTKNDLFLARFLVRELGDKYGITIKIESQSTIPEGRKVVVMGDIGNPLIKRYILDNKLQITDKNPGPEGYILHVSRNKIVIAGCDNPGAFFGLQSLRQLIAIGNGAEVQGLKVTDWPNLSFRAIRLFVPGPEEITFFERFLRDFMALYKFNKVIIEIPNMRLDSHPELNTGWVDFANELRYSRSNTSIGPNGEQKDSPHYDAGDGFIIEKDKVRDIVNFANENFIEVIPELPSLTHSYYILTRHSELAENPGDKWPDTYCPSNPEVYDLLFEVLDEYIDVIKPKMIHIGHDEWRMPLEVCPLCKGKDYSELFAQDVNEIHNYLSDKGIKVAMWGDHLLESVRNIGPREALTATGEKYLIPGGLRPSVVRNSIPKDILIFNWFWDDQEKDIELQEFGFTQFYGNFEPNIDHWEERMKKIDVVGGAPSSWASTNECNFGKDQMFDFLGCANLLWSNHTLDLAELSPIVIKLIPYIRSNLSSERIPSEDGNTIQSMDISSHFNLASDPNVFNIDLSKLKTGAVYCRTKQFNIITSDDESGKCAIAVGSQGIEENPLPSEIKGIPINDDVSSLLFLHACAFPAGNYKAFYSIFNFFDTSDLLGYYEVIYADGFKAIIPIQYGVNILEWNAKPEKIPVKIFGEGIIQNTYCYLADPIQCSSNEKENPITFYVYEWINPRYGKIIKEVKMYGSLHYQSNVAMDEPVMVPLPSNAILLTGISKVIKRDRNLPKLDEENAKQ
ncbi:MAG: glycoside hydrolase family 20 zincin-like fold domain-containing protein [Bacteroidota bacterium]